MNKKSIFSLFLILTLLTSMFYMFGCSSGKSKGSSAKHVVLISLDGSRPVFYMDKSWPAPHLQKLKNEGVYASKGIESIFPSITYPSHTSIITGAYPIHDGIYYNIPFFMMPFGTKPVHHLWYAAKIKTKTLWEAVREAGLTSGSVDWPLSLGAPINYNWPVRHVEKGEKGNIISVHRAYNRPKGLLHDVEKETGHQFSPADFSFKGDDKLDKTFALISNYIIKKYKPSFMDIHFGYIDHMEHAHGTSGPYIKKAVSVVDSLVGTVVQAIKDAGIWKNTALIITGDHGHTDIKATFAPNVYLARHGLISKNNWKAQFYPAGGSAFLYLRHKNNQSILDSVISIMKHTPEYKKGDFKILDRAALNKMGANPNPSLALAMKNGISVRNGIKGKILKIYKPPYHHSTHGFDPAYSSMHTMFIAVGAGIAKHKDIKGMGIVDIAPIISNLLNLNFKVPDGKLIPGILLKIKNDRN